MKVTSKERNGRTIWIFDRSSRVIVAANDSAVSAYGYTREELLERLVDDICRDPGGRPLTSLLPNSSSAGWTGIARHHRKDGSAFDADISMIGTGDVAQTATMVVVHLH